MSADRERKLDSSQVNVWRMSSTELDAYKFQDTKSHGPSFVVIFTENEKREELRGHVFREAHFDGVDFSRADLSFARFENVTLTACNFARANLRGASFVRCDLRWSTFERVRFAKNHFELAFFAGCTGLIGAQRRYVERHGGTFTVDAPRGIA